MSRVGKHAIAIPSGMTVEVKSDHVKAKGKLGEGVVRFTGDVAVKMADGKVTVTPVDGAANRAMWATTQRNISNLFKGLESGFEKKLEITGVGYRAQVAGKELVLQLGYSHDVKYQIPEGIKIAVEKQTAITISGADKQRVGQVAAEIRAWREPEPYKGKGIKYEGERIIRKEGKKK
ncbi:MAG: 50S ribosomal protein L6 [Rhodospirillales bacterium]|nr:50S ribosomal protein L6 [Rhodospirillales bacterium]USO06982.1 MAG: 50S ribosomal protein L6 [Rhodospirillales bacterium]